MKVHDISMAVYPGMLLYPGTPAFQRDEYRSMREGDTSNNSRISMGAHAGTHVDAPYHYLKDGSKTESLPLQALVGPARLFHLEARRGIGAEDLRGCDWGGVKRALFKTRMSHAARGDQFDPEFVYLEASAAEFLAERNLLLVGIDSPSIDRFRSLQHPAHHTLLKRGIVVVEGLDLADVGPGDYILVCAPLKIVGAEAAPARALLLEVDGEIRVDER